MSDIVENLKADNEWLIHAANRLVDALRPFMRGLKGQYPSFTNELPIFAGASADDLQFVLKIGDFRRAHYLVEEFDKKNYSKELPILMEYEEKLACLRAENEKLREALKPFAEVLTFRDCGAVVFEDIEIDHVYAARKALGE